jgi:NIMA (never in mitosis gene a)-related kinase
LYIAPEIWRRRRYGQKCDIWSLGVLLYEMMTFRFPFTANSQHDLQRRVCAGYYATPRGYSSELVSVLRLLLQVNPVVRPSVAQLLANESIRSRMHLIEQFVPQENLDSQNRLLSTIKVPSNLRNVDLPSPAYGRGPSVAKPLDQRIHLRKGVPVRKELSHFSSPELKLVCDRDLWSPNRVDNSDSRDDVVTPPHTHLPLSARPVLNPLPPAAPFPIPAINPRLRRINIH